MPRKQQLSPETVARELTGIWDAGGEAAGVEPVEVPPPSAPRPKRVPKNRREGLTMAPATPLKRHGLCPGGRYAYVTDPALAARLLNGWAAQRLWAAVDLETSCAERFRPGPAGGPPERYYETLPDPFTSKLFLCAVSVEPGTTIVFDMRVLGQQAPFAAAFGRFLRECRLVAHNAAFEMSFFAAQWGTPGNVVYDTMVAHQLASAGLAEGSGLGELMQKFQGLALEKKWQRWFIKIHPESPLCDEAIAYSAADVCQLLPLMLQVDQALTQQQGTGIWETIERPFLPWLVRARVRGVAIDREVFAAMDRELEIEAGVASARFRALAPDTLISSWQQLLVWFAAQGVELEGTDETTLKAMMKRQPAGSKAVQAAEAILAYRDAHKQRSTYLQPYLTSLPSPHDGRIHPNWKQTSTVTGRMACSDPNLQNLPSKGPKAKIRSGFVAEEGHLLAWADYSQFEVRALADAANETRMIRVFEEGKAAAEALAAYCQAHGLRADLAELAEAAAETDPAKAAKTERAQAAWQGIYSLHPQTKALVRQLAACDFHRRTAALLFKKEPEAVTKEERARSKCVTFGVPYGAGPPGIAAQAGITVEEAKTLLNDYYRAFPAVKRFLDLCQKRAKRGSTATAGGRLRFYEPPEYKDLFVKARAIEQAAAAGDGTAQLRWQGLQKKWFATSAAEIAERQHRFAVGKIAREGSNQPIQGVNADATKLATVIAGPRLQALDPRIDILMWVHDEIVLTAPEAVAHEAGLILQEGMREAARRFLTRCPVETSLALGKCWGK